MASHYSTLRTYTFLAPRRTIFGTGVVEKVGEEAKQIGGKRALVVTDEGVEKTGLLDRAKSPLEREGLTVTVFNQVEPEPRIEVANLVTEAVRKAEYDIVVGIGGGSSMDMAKVASIMATNPGQPSQYIGVNLVKRMGLPTLMVPTTSGTGSEATTSAVITYEGRKTGVASPHLMPTTAVVDPSMTMSMPPKLTASTGMDALSHAVEAYVSVDASPLTDVIALEAIRLIANNLPVAYSNGENVEARSNMSQASLMAGMAIGNAGTCGGHATAYGYAVRLGLSHGVSCAMALPYIMDFNAISCLSKMAKIAEAMGENVWGLSLWEASAAAVGAVQRLGKELCIPQSLKELNVSREAIPAMAEDMLRVTRLLVHNPRKVTKEDAVRIYERMWEGTLEIDWRA